MERTLLSETISLSDYKKLIQQKDKVSLVEFIYKRIHERYIKPMHVDPDLKNGFTIMAVSCLTIETLESFYKGWPNTKGKSNEAFRSYFSRNSNFSFLKDYHDEFYKNVRCGILHQGETTNGWHIRRDGNVFNLTTKTINATRFHKEVEKSLDNYSNELIGEDWESDIWKNFRQKMGSICDNCECSDD